MRAQAARTLLQQLHTGTDARVALRLACIGSANTDAEGAPCTTALAVRLSDGAAFPATFEDRGPGGWRLEGPQLEGAVGTEERQGARACTASAATASVLHLLPGV